MEQLSLASLSDERLVEELGVRVRRENEQKAGLLPYIAEVDRRRLYAKLGYSSMFKFCVRHFQMSEPTAVKRIRAARTAQKFPVLFGMIARAEIHLSGLLRLSAHLTGDNHVEVLAEAKHKTLAEIDELVARLAPKPDVRSTLRALPRPSPGATAEPLHLFAPAAPSSSAPAAAPPALPRAPATTPPRTTRAPDPMPLAPGKHKLAITLTDEGRSNLHRLQGLHAHRIPSGDPAAIVELALRTLLEQTLKRKAAITDKPRSTRAETAPSERRSRDVPAAIKRAVWQRDGGSCSYVGPDGKRCGEIRCLEFAHLDPWAKGGDHSVDNVALRCRPHNCYEAIRDYGELFMQRKIREALSTREPIAAYRPRWHPEVAARLHGQWPRDLDTSFPHPRTCRRPHGSTSREVGSRGGLPPGHSRSSAAPGVALDVARPRPCVSVRLLPRSRGRRLGEQIVPASCPARAITPRSLPGRA